MRLWSLHPSYLDQRGLNAVWREGLLAQAVLLGRTEAWKNHPQLTRFRSHEKPIEAIGFYLLGIREEAKIRGYNYDVTRIAMISKNVVSIEVTNKQLLYELDILLERLRKRDSCKCKEVLDSGQMGTPKPHPLFATVDGEIEPWEKSYLKRATETEMS